MDIPRYHHHNHRHLRYKNVPHPPDFNSPHYTHHRLPPPPPHAPPHYVSHPPLSPRFSFSSPPHQPILERSYPIVELEPSPKPYFHRHHVPTLPQTPPPPPPPLPLPLPLPLPSRLVRDYYDERKPISRDKVPCRYRSDSLFQDSSGISRDEVPYRFRSDSLFQDSSGISRDEIPYRYRSDSLFQDSSGISRDEVPYRCRSDSLFQDSSGISRDEVPYRYRSDSLFQDSSSNWDRNLSSTSVLGVGYRERCLDVDHRSGGEWDSGGVGDRVRDLWWDESGCSGFNDRGRGLYGERDGDERRWGVSSSGRLRELYDYDGRRWDVGRTDSGCGLYNERDGYQRRLDARDRAHELYRESDGDGRSCEHDTSNGVLSRLGNRRQECLVSELDLGRFSGRLGRGVSKKELTTRSKKKRKVQKKGALHRIQLGKLSRMHGEGYKCQPIPEESNNGSFRRKGKERSKWLGSRMDEKREREQSPMELAISFKSNGLVAKAMLAPSQAEMEPDESLTPRNISTGDMTSVSGLPDANSSKDFTNPNFLTHGLRGTSEELLDQVSSRESGSARVKMTNANGEIVNAINCTKDPSEVPQLNSNTKISDGRVVSDTVLLTSLQSTFFEKAEANGDSFGLFAPNLKRKRSSLTTVPNSSHVADDIISDSSCHAERFLTTTANTDHVCQLGTDEVAGTLLANDNTGHGDSSGLNLHANNVDISGNILASALNSEKTFVDSFSRPQEFRLLMAQEDKCSPEVHKSYSALECDGAVLQETSSFAFSDLGSGDASSKNFYPDQVSLPEVGVDAEEPKSSKGASVPNCSDTSLNAATSSGSLPKDHEETLAEFDVSFHDGMSKQSLNDAIGSPEAINNVKTSASSKIKRKRKARGAPMGFSGSKANVVLDTISSSSGEVASLLVKDYISPVEVDFQKEFCKENDCVKEGPSGAEDSVLDVDFVADGYTKKIKVVSPSLPFALLSGDDVTGDDLTRDCSKFDRGSSTASLLAADQINYASSSSAYNNKCDSSYTEVGGAKWNFADMDETLTDVNKLHVDDDLALNPADPSLSADGNGVVTSYSDDDLAFGSDMPSDVSSPEYLLSHSDFCPTINTEAPANLPNDQMICGEDKMYRRPPTAVSSTFFPGNYLKKAASGNFRTNTQITLPQENCKALLESNVVHGKMTFTNNQLNSVPNAFSGHLPSSVTSSRRFPSHVSKSRTWHRTGDASVPITEPKEQTSQSQETNMIRNIHSSYVRKGNSLVRKPSPSSVAPPGLRSSSSSVYRRSPAENLKNKPAFDNKVGNADDPAILRKPSPSSIAPPTLHSLSSSVYRRSPYTEDLKKIPAFDSKVGNADAPAMPRVKRLKTFEMPESMPLNNCLKSSNSSACSPSVNLPVVNPSQNDCNTPDAPSNTSDALDEMIQSSPVLECQNGPGNSSDSQSVPEEGKLRKKIRYVKRRSNQLVAASDSEDMSALDVGNAQASLSDGYYKKSKNQLVRTSIENHVRKGDAAAVNANTRKLGSQAILLKRFGKMQSGFAKAYRSKFSFVWKLHDAKSSEKHKNLKGPQKVWPYMFSWKRATHWKTFMHALASKSKGSSFSTTTQKLLLSRKRGAIYTRSIHGYSLRMSKVVSVGGSSLKWSKSIERNSKKANEEAAQAVAASLLKEQDGKDDLPGVSKSRNHSSRERIFRIGSERYKMDPSRRTLHRITAEEGPSSSVAQSENKVKRSYVPRRLLIGNDEYVRIGNGNQLVRDPKKRTRILASEKVRWSLRTARLKLARKRKFCQFFTRYGKCNKDGGKCPYIHDPSKIVVCTKFLNGACSDPNCKLTHKVIPERMQDCSFFLKGSCSNENCPYRHVNVDPDSTVCENFLRGYCADGNECEKKHTYVCPAFEATGICTQASTCKLHHPKKKTERKQSSEQKILRGRYFDGGLIGLAECNIAATTEKLSSAKVKDEIERQDGNFPDYISLDMSDEVARQEGKNLDCISLGVRDHIRGSFPDYISLNVSDDEVGHGLAPEQSCDELLPTHEM